jgi:hypothetical protein
MYALGQFPRSKEKGNLRYVNYRNIDFFVVEENLNTQVKF